MTDLLSGLNPQQRDAVTVDGSPALVLAGPGSGKTRVLTHRVAWLIQAQEVVPHRIMAVTFTNKAAREMRHRIEELLGGRLRGLEIGTFHAICARILRREADFIPLGPDYVIYDTPDQLSLVKQALADLNMDDKRFPPTRMHNMISRAKNELIEPELYRSESYFAEAAGRVYERYMELLVANNAADFDDLLMRTALLLAENAAVRERYQRRYDHVLVDEFQDTNMAQYSLLRDLGSGHRNVFCVGDPDQSIYGWRGADYRNVQRFEENFTGAETILLEQNYRSTQVILDVAMAVIDKAPGRKKKKLFTDREGGPNVTLYESYDERDEAQFVVETIAGLVATAEANPGDCAVMYRTNAQSRALEDAFLRAGLPYKLVGAIRFYQRREIKDLIAYLRVVYNPNDSVSLNRIINVPTRGIGQKTLGNLKIWAEKRSGTLWEALDALARGEDSPFTGRALNALRGFAQMVRGWREVARELSVPEVLDLVIDETGFHDALDDGTEEGAERWENVVELRNVAAEYEGLNLETFLEEVALVSDVDNLPDDADAPTLLTLHSAKGLEFPLVFIVGLEEGLLPHQRSFDEPDGIDEERRLLYVGMTRAQDRLFLLYAFRRTVWGDNAISLPSRFLDDIPEELLSGNVPLRSERTTPAWADYKRAITWESDAAPPQKAAQTTTYRPGQRVSHAKFGEGVVIESRVTAGEEEVSVAFEESGLKRLIASMAPMQILD